MRSIGIFDSGIGGLTVLAHVEKLLPGESLVYLGDTARVPYGTKSRETIERFAREDVRFLRQQDVKMIIAACNTVSALALEALEREIDIPLLGVIAPAVEKALHISSRRRIGVIATRSTIASRAYERAFQERDGNVEVISVACPLFVSLVEEDWIREPETRSIASRYLQPLIERRVDTLILGCTHYPLLKDVIQEVMGAHVVIIDSAYWTAWECAKLLRDRALEETCEAPARRFFVTDETARFKSMSARFLGRPVLDVNRVEIDLPLTSVLSRNGRGSDTVEMNEILRGQAQASAPTG